MVSQSTAVICLASVALLRTVSSNNAFLKASHSIEGELISEEEIQTSLLAEVEAAFGSGSAAMKLKQIQADLLPMYATLPKNEHGYLGHATACYALHRLFVQRHGWSVKGLHVAGTHRNSSSRVGLLKEHVPAYLQDIFEKRLAGRGVGVHELSVLAATIEHLVHNEVIKRLGYAFQVQKLLPTDKLSMKQVDRVLDMYMAAYILGEDLSNYTSEEAAYVLAEMPHLSDKWSEMKGFVRSIRKSIAESDRSAEQKASRTFDFALVARAAVRIGEQFGNFQDRGCHQMKESLLALEDKMPGRVRLPDFWKPALDGVWHFQESRGYLQQLGALDEANPENPRVIIPNYLSSSSNCMSTSSFYSVCCKDECEGLMGQLEKDIAAPEAQPQQIIASASKLSSSSVAAPRTLSQALVEKLDHIAIEHGGTVQLHGRLFAQWMHHAFPRDCPYPHLAGTINPLTPDEWIEASGEHGLASEEEIRLAVDKAQDIQSHEADELPWVHQEELLFHRPVTMWARCKPVVSTLSNGVLLSALAAFAYSIVNFLHLAMRGRQGMKLEKHMV